MLVEAEHLSLEGLKFPAAFRYQEKAPYLGGQQKISMSCCKGFVLFASRGEGPAVGLHLAHKER